MKIGFACGMFDLFHVGHVLMLKECKLHCDYLIIAVNSGCNISERINPKKSKPILTLDERVLVVESCRYVDEVLTYTSEEDLLAILTSIKIDIRFLGEDYFGNSITGEDLKLEIFYINRDHGYSTTYIKNRIVDVLVKQVDT